MAEKPRKPTDEYSGTMICGADGAVYFIPDAELEAYRISDTNEREVQQDVDRLMAVRGLQGEGEIDFPITIHGPIGRRPSGVGSNSATLILIDPCALRKPERRPGL
jgi:hypothetical protein